MAEVIVPADSGLLDPDIYSSVGNVRGEYQRLFKARWSTNAARRFFSDVTVHGNMLDKAEPITRPTFPIYYVRTAASAPPALASSVDTPINLLAEQYYNQVQNHLVDLRDLSDTEDEVVERGAINTALTVLDKLHERHVAPPEITHHGGDAVVMLWALGSATYAITITEGEVGWVVQRDRRQISSKDSVRIENFRLMDLR
ncbi:hypothetical protein [Novosphingobium kaempferiae]|uniref:hypothetical protein n=1 Tax=Novosphingobium kaempferiae TaxID=2896849 RepID=UPI001E3AADF0|nr:hypothetical protein [Novosphingobium kaempferiae]